MMNKSTNSQTGSRWKLFVLFVMLGLVFVVLFALGSWQVYRLQWKESLIERVTTRVHAAAVTAPTDWTSVNRDNSEYLHVTVKGKYLYQYQVLSYALTDLGDGYWVMTPLQQEDNSIIYINRGFVPTEHHTVFLAQAGDDAGVVKEVTGLLRISEPKGGFLRPNEPQKNKWFSRDITEMAQSANLQDVAPYFIDAEKNAVESNAYPIAGMTQIKFANNHLVYAITWYSMALLLIVMLVYIRKSNKQKQSSSH